MKCILHIGTEKTATTLLQNWLYSNRDALGQQGVYLPTTVGFPNNRLLPAYFRESLDDWCRAERINSIEEKSEYFRGFEAAFSAEIERASETHDVTVLTSEHFHSRVTERKEIEKLHTFLSQHFSSITVVCYFRNQADMAVSLYSTALKAADRCSLDDFLKNVVPEAYYYNFLKIAEAWSAVFGFERCMFRIYDRDQFFQGDIRRDFLSISAPKVETALLDFSMDNANESLTRFLAAAFRAVNEHVPYWGAGTSGIDPVNVRLKNALSQIGSLKHGPQHTALSREILQRFSASNSEFFRVFLNTSNLFAATLGGESKEAMVPVDQVGEMLRDVISVVLQQTHDHRAPVASRLADRDAEVLRDVALKIENRATLNLDDALSLMLLAHRARPTGSLIKQKIADYRARVGSK